MMFFEMKQMTDELDRLLRAGKYGKCVFLSLPDADSYREIRAFLLDTVTNELRLSEYLLGSDRLPTASCLLGLLKTMEGNVLLSPAAELLRPHAFVSITDLLEGVAKRKKVNLFLPLIGCENELAALGKRMKTPPVILTLAGDEEQPETIFVEKAVAAEDCVSYLQYLIAMEEGRCVNERIAVHGSLRFVSPNSRVYPSAYSLMNGLLSEMEFVSCVPALDDAQWLPIVRAVEEKLAGGSMPALAFFAECAKDEDAGKLIRTSPLRLLAWMYRLQGCTDGVYLRSILSRMALYESVSDAAALEIFAEFRRGFAEGCLTPENTGSDEWLSLREERARILKQLHIMRLPEECAKLMQNVPEKRRMLYSSLCTEDEREYAYTYFTEIMHMSRLQILDRRDVRRMWKDFHRKGEKRELSETEETEE